MKRLKYYLLILCAGAFAACTDLDIPPKNIFNEKDIFGNVEGATSYLARLYGVLPMEDFRYSFEHGFGYSGAMYRQMCCATGEAVGRDTQGFFAEPGSNMWDAAYKTIREINLISRGFRNTKADFRTAITIRSWARPISSAPTCTSQWSSVWAAFRRSTM